MDGKGFRIYRSEARLQRYKYSLHGPGSAGCDLQSVRMYKGLLMTCIHRRAPRAHGVKTGTHTVAARTQALSQSVDLRLHSLASNFS